MDLKTRIKTYMKRDCFLEVVPVLDSTNRVLKELAAQGAPEGTVLLAEEQTAGRGRLGRSFFSPAGSGLYFSVLLRPKKGDPQEITVAAGVAVARAVEKILGQSLKIKWVNDLYKDDKKVCGILAEGAAGEEGFAWCVLGIGLNIYAPRQGFGALDAIAGALLEGTPDDEVRAKLTAGIIEEFFALYEGEEPYLEEYRSRSYLQGKTVTAVQGALRFKGIVRGISDRAELLLEREDGTVVPLSSGEVQLEDYR